MTLDDDLVLGIVRVSLRAKALLLLPYANEIAASRDRVRDEHMPAERTGQQNGSHAATSAPSADWTRPALGHVDRQQRGRANLRKRPLRRMQVMQLERLSRIEGDSRDLVERRQVRVAAVGADERAGAGDHCALHREIASRRHALRDTDDSTRDVRYPVAVLITRESPGSARRLTIVLPATRRRRGRTSDSPPLPENTR